VTRVLVTRQPGGHPDPDHGASGDRGTDDLSPGDGRYPDYPSSVVPGASGPSAKVSLQERLQTAMALLPPVLGGAPTQPLNLGRATRVVQPAQRHALAVRDRGCVFPSCDRPLAWSDAHHLWHWIDGDPTNLANLALLCRAHHRAVHEGGWQLTRGPDGHFSATPGPPPHRPHRRQQPSAA